MSEVIVNALMFTTEQEAVIRRHIANMTKRDKEIYELAYNTGLKYGYRTGYISAFGIVVAAIVLFSVLSYVL